MPTRNVILTAEQDAFIDEMLERGEYRNAGEAVGDAIGALKQRRARRRSSSTSCGLRSKRESPRSIAASSLTSRTRTWTPISTSLVARPDADCEWRGIGFPLWRTPTSLRS
jgi:Arc/MetJ-type ribon-helix-helix transcriptional regulator